MTTDHPPKSPFGKYLFSFAVLIGLVVLATVLILALTGPTVGNIFSNVSRGLSRDGGSGYSGGSSSAVIPTAIVRPASESVSSQSPAVMKAGEIDDNAQWDTYTQFRRDFLNGALSYNIIDVDVTGRRIIKVIDSRNQPVLGARVTICADSQVVSESLTYATGMTLFLPNADERSQRRDNFQVGVRLGDLYTVKDISLRSVGDVIEIRLPINSLPPVMTFTPNPPY